MYVCAVRAQEGSSESEAARGASVLVSAMRRAKGGPAPATPHPAAFHGVAQDVSAATAGQGGGGGGGSRSNVATTSKRARPLS